jgi:nitrate/nitrite transporter NarK
MTTYYTFYLIHHFQASVRTSQLLLFVFLFSVALGTIIGGPVGDRIGRKRVIWVSILGVAPFSLLLPHAGLTGTVILTVFIGTILASAFSAILVYAQELPMPFRALGLDPKVLQAVRKPVTPSRRPFKSAAIPPIIAGHDLIGIAQTGTGKTAAFTLPILTRLAAVMAMDAARHARAGSGAHA